MAQIRTVSHKRDAMNYKSLLFSLLPPVSYNRVGPNLTVELIAEGRQLDDLEHSSTLVRNAITPWLAEDLIVDWERVLEIQVTVNDSYTQRVERVLLKLSETGGLSINYFINLAKKIGYTIEIVELEPFYADYSRVGDVVYDDDVIWAWQVVVSSSSSSSSSSFLFRASGSSAGERLLKFGDPIIETLFEDLKPAHTFVYFSYL